MSEESKAKSPTRLQVIYFTILLIAVFILTFLIFKPFITVLILALTMSVLLHPVFNWILKRVNNLRIVAAILTVIIAIIILLIPIFFLGRQVFLEARNTYGAITTGQGQNFLATDYLQAKINNIFPNINIDLRSYLSEFVSWFFSNLGSFFSGTLDIALKSLLVVVALFYLLKDGDRFRKAYVSLSPLQDEYDEKILNKLQISVISIIRGSFLVALVQGTLCGIGFLLFGLPNPALWGMVAAISALVPGFGTSLVLAPAIAYLFFTGPLGPAIGLLLWGVLLVGLIDNFLSPKIIERGINIHPLFILFSVIGGVTFFGPGGFIIGPLVLSLLFTLFEIYALLSHHEKKEQGVE